MCIEREIPKKSAYKHYYSPLPAAPDLTEHRNVTDNIEDITYNSTNYRTGPGCSKLTMSLVNVSLKFQMLISEICQHFLLKKCEKLLYCNKKYHIFGYKVVKHLTA